MYVVTFYSFKGGVGRTLAVLNVAYELAQSGFKVLVVDSDLEAPGIHAHRWRSPTNDDSQQPVGASSDHIGLVEYVSQYRMTLQPPDVSEHIWDATPKGCNGQIALMPAGHLDDTYSARLNEIDWNELYERHDGYLMFEDMRAQWEALAFDYVLVDSRTGFTDVGGICTRHLPDAVVTMFRPDDQSLRGMEEVVQSIRREETTPRRKQEIVLHFVMAAIPDTDDEHGILKQRRHVFQDHLEIPFGRLLEIRHYQSMDLLTQPIYTRMRPRTLLARSYRRLTKRIRALNVGDRGGILHYLQDARRDPRERRDTDFLNQIRQQYGDDPEVLGELAETYYDRGSLLDAVDLLETTADLGCLTGSQQIRLAELRHVTGDPDRAARALMTFFKGPQADPSAIDDRSYHLVFRGLHMLDALGEDRVAYVAGSQLIGQLPSSERVRVARNLDRSRNEQGVAVAILRDVLANSEILNKERSAWAWHLAFALIAIGEFAEARKLYDAAYREQGGPPRVATAFNLAMALWAETGTPDASVFRNVLDALDADDDTSELDESANALQALGVAAWFGGRKAASEAYLDRAEEAIRRRRSEVSCWSYTRVMHGEFHTHCDEIRSLLAGNKIEPIFMRQTSSHES